MDEPLAEQQASEGSTQSTPATDATPRASGAHRVAVGTGRTLLTLVAVGVLLITGYSWVALHRLDQGIARTDVFGNTPTQTPDSATGNSSAQAPPPLTSDVNILVVGLDSRTDPHGNPLPANELDMLHAGPNDGELNTDTMMLVHIPAGGQRAVAISFPRDSWVQLAGGFGMHRLNSALAYGRNAAITRLQQQGMTDNAQIMQQANTEGRQNLIATIENLIGNAVTINRYAEINLAGFYQLSEAVGGVQVCLKQATHDDFTGASFPAGEQTITGGHALDFVRQRHGLPGGDLDRIVRQQVFLGALAKKVLSAGTLTDPGKIAALTEAIQNSVTLSTGWDIASFAAQMQNLSSGAIQFGTMPTGAPEVIGGADVLAVDPAAVRSYVRDLVNGTGTGVPTGLAEQSGTAGSTTAPPPTVTSTTPTSTSATTSSPSRDAGQTGPITADGTPCVN